MLYAGGFEDLGFGSPDVSCRSEQTVFFRRCQRVRALRKGEIVALPESFCCGTVHGLDP